MRTCGGQGRVWGVWFSVPGWGGWIWTGRIMQREHTGKGLRETPPRDSRCSGGVARRWVIPVNLPAILWPWEGDLCGLHHPGTGKDLRETPPKDSRCSGGVARRWVIPVNLPAILCALERWPLRTASPRLSCPLARNWLWLEVWGLKERGIGLFPPPLPSCLGIAFPALVASFYNHSFCQEALLPWLQLFSALIIWFLLLALGL